MQGFDRLISSAKSSFDASNSKNPQGAALLSKEGEVFCGTKVELTEVTVSAVKAAISNAFLKGSRRFTALAIYGGNIEAEAQTLRSLKGLGDMWVITSDGKNTETSILSKILNSEK